MTHRTITIRPVGLIGARPIVKHTTTKIGTMWALWQIVRATIAVYEKHGTTSQIVKEAEDGIMVFFLPTGGTVASMIFEIVVDSTPASMDAELSMT